MMKVIRNLTLIFLVLLILGFLLIVVTYSLPVDIPHEHVVEDAGQFTKLNRMLIPNYNSTKLALYTDSKILSELSYYNKNVSLINNAMSSYGSVGTDFHKYIDGDESVMVEYARYWHGNLVVYKPLFELLDYDAIKILQLFFELIMIIAITKLMLESNLKNFIVPFLLSIFLIHPEVIGLCLQYATMFNIMLISVYILLKFKDYLFVKNRLIYYFFIIGIATSYFDLLTYPLISFGIPIIFYILLSEDKTDVKNMILKIILFGLIWSLGFIGMWLAKLIISSIILQKNIVENALNQFIFRTSTDNFSRLDALFDNLLIYKKRSYLIIAALIGIYYIKKLINFRENISLSKLKECTPLILISLIPFIWFIIVSNHSHIHYYFTYRELIIFFFAFLCILEYLIVDKIKLIGSKK